MRSAWFWGTPEWAEYQHEYHAGHVPDEYKTSPLAHDEDFDWGNASKLYQAELRDSVVVDLTMPSEALWQDVRKSYHSLIHRAQRDYWIDWVFEDRMEEYRTVHTQANGIQPRPSSTYEIQHRWLSAGRGMLVGAKMNDVFKAFAYWILYAGCAYYASGPSIEQNVQHAVIWKSLELLKARGFKKAEIGDISGHTEKEQNIAKFKKGFGGDFYPFTIITRRAA